jgi:hypothetical protein
MARFPFRELIEIEYIIWSKEMEKWHKLFLKEIVK